MKFTKVIFKNGKSEEEIKQWLKEHGFSTRFKIRKDKDGKHVIFKTTKYVDRIAKVKLDDHVFGILHYKSKKAAPASVKVSTSSSDAKTGKVKKVKLTRNEKQTKKKNTGGGRKAQEVVTYPEGTIIPKSKTGRK